MWSGRTRRFLKQVAISAGCVGLLIWQTDLADLRQAMSGATWFWVAPAVLFVAASKVMHGLRWWLLVRRTGAVPLRDAVLLLLAATGVSVLLPLRTGAVLQMQVLRSRYGINRAVVAGTLVAEGLLDACLLLLLAVVAVPVLGLGNAVVRAALVAVLSVAALVGGALLLGMRRRGRPWFPLPKRLESWAGETLKNLLHGIATLGGPRTVAILMLPTAGDWALASTAHWLVGLSLGLGTPVYAYVAVEIVGNLVGAVPLSQASIGPYDVAVRQTVAAFGVDLALATAFAVITHATIIVAEFGSGLVAAWLLRLRLRDLFYIRAGDVGDRPSDST